MSKYPLLRPYHAIIAPLDSAAATDIRETVMAESLSAAKLQLEATHGEGAVKDLRDDVCVYKCLKPYLSISEVPRGEWPLPLGSLQEVQQAILGRFHTTNWTEPGRGVYDSTLGSIEFFIGLDDPVLGIRVLVSEVLKEQLHALCEAQTWLVLDPWTGKFLQCLTSEQSAR